MTVYDADTVDHIGLVEREAIVLLGIVIPGPLDRSPELLSALVTKINGYVRFIKSGTLERNYPDAKGLVPYIELAHVGALDESGLKLIESIGAQLVDLQIGLRTLDLEVVEKQL